MSALRATLRLWACSRSGSRLMSSGSSKLTTSYVHTPGQVPFLGMTVGEAFDRAENQRGDHLVVVSSHQKISRTYSQVKTEIDRLASGLIALGLKKGDKVCIWAPNIYEWFPVQIACAKAGLIAVLLNPGFLKLELEYCLRKAECSTIVITDRTKNKDYYETLKSVLPELPDSKLGRVNSSRLPFLKYVIMATDSAKPGTITVKDVMNAGGSDSDKSLAAVQKDIDFDDPLQIQFTSGTTGSPKAAILSHHSVLNNALFGGRGMGFNETPPICCCQVPLFHSFGSTLGPMMCLVHQFTLVLPSLLFDSKETLHAIQSERCNTIYGTPTMFVAVLNELNINKGKYDVETLKKIIVGGAPCPREILKTMKDVFGTEDLLNGYGCTETSPGIYLCNPHDPIEKKLASSGSPLEYCEAKVVDRSGKIVPVNTPGELLARGYMVFKGYLDDEAKTKEAIDENRWYHTGDLAEMDEDGYIKIVGRIKDMIIRGGENIFPADIEQFLHTHPKILEAHVVGVPDKVMGEEICAWVCLKQGESMTTEDVKDFCKKNLSHFKVPRYIIFIKDFPKTLSGKVQKFKMLEQTIEMFKKSNKS